MLWMAPPTGTTSVFSPCHPALIEQHDGGAVRRAARREAIEEYVHGVGIDLGRTSAKASSVAGRPAA
jgi:hypothetical protein